MSLLHMQVIEDGNRNVKIKSTNANKEFAPEEISAQVSCSGSTGWQRHAAGLTAVSTLQ
jgi:hypothetical protein